MKQYEVNFKLSVKENSATSKVLATSLLKELVVNKEDYVYLSFVLTQNSESAFAEKVFSILRYANALLEYKDSYFSKLLGEEKYTLECSLPIAKNEYGKNINVLKGYGDGLRINRIKVRLVSEKEKLISKEAGIVITSVKEGSKSAGKVASRIVRTLIKDGNDCVLRFVLTKNNALEMSNKIMSALRITSRMIKDPASVIGEGLPNKKVDYEIKLYGPFINKVPSLSDSNIEILTNDIYLKCK